MGRMERYWRGKVAVVTGGSTGMGRELVLQLAAAGASIAACDVNVVELERTKSLAQAAASDVVCTTHVVDVSDRPRVLAFVEEVLAAHDRIDALFNNAGVVAAQTTFATSFEEWDRVVGINLYGVVNCTLAFLPHLTKSPQAAVVNTSSMAGIAGMLGNSAYGTAKFAVRGFTEVLLAEARFLAPQLQVTVVHPGGVTTDIFKNCQDLVHDTKIQVGSVGGLKTGQELHDLLQMIGGTTPTAAASQILIGVARGQTRILIGTDCCIVDIVSRISPHFMLSGRWVNLVVPGLATVVGRFVGCRVLTVAAGLAAAVAYRRRPSIFQ